MVRLDSVISLTTLFIFCILLVSSVFAQETIDEITVTADFRARSELDIPSSISVLDKIFIEKSSTQHFQDLIYNIPNLNWSGDGNRPRYFQIRGIGELEQYQGAPNPSVGFLIDDIDYSGIGSIATLFDIEQIEIVKGPSSLLYANGTIGGIINVVDNCIAEGNYDKQEFIAGLETQSVNDGDVQHLNYKNNIAGFNVNFGYKNSEFGNFDIPDGAVMHDEDHEGHDEHEEEEELSYLENSDLEVESTKFGISRAGAWGYFGVSVDNLESIYGIPYHGEHGDEHGDEHDDHDDDHGDDHDDHDDDDHGDEHEGERIFSTTDSESLTVKGLYLSLIHI